MADYKGLTIKFTGDDSDLTRALMNIEGKAASTQKTLTLVGSGLGYGLKTGGGALSSLGKSMSNLGDKLSIISGAMLLTFGRKMVQSVQEFGDEIARVGGYLGISGSQLEYMEELALKFGKDTQYSATEAAQAISELAKGGLTEAQIAGGALDSTLQLAAAGQMDFGAAAKVTAQALKAFNLEAEDSTKVSDALAGAATNSVASVEGLATGFTYAASWARNAGWSINDVSGALALLADYGIDAEMGGTALRNVMLRLAAPTDKAAGIMKDLGIEVRDAYGNMKSITEVIDEFNIALAGVTPDEKDSIISAIFGVRGANAALALLDAGSEKLKTYIGYTQDTGAALRMAKAQMGELGWAIELMRGEAETASVNFMEQLEPTLIDLANTAEELFSWFNSLSDAERKQIVNMALMTVGIGPLLSITGRLISGFGGVTSAIGTATMGISGFIHAMRAGGGFKNSLSAMFASANMVEFAEGASMASKALAGMKLGLVGVGVALAGLFIWKATEDWRKASEEAKRLEQHTDRLRDASSSLMTTIDRTHPSLERASTTYRLIGEEADTSAEHIDELAEAHMQLAETVESRNRSAQETIDMLSTAKTIINDYAGREHLAAEETAKLQWALDLVNQETGHNYELMYAYSGVVGENGEAVDNLVESLDKLIDARMREAEAAAISANMTDIYKDRLEQEREAAALEEKVAFYRERTAKLQANIDAGLYDNDPQARARAMELLDEYSTQLGVVSSDLAGVNAQIADDTQALEFYTQKYSEIIGAVDTLDEKLAAILHVAGKDIFGGLGDRAEEFVNRIDAANKKLDPDKVIDYTTVTQSQWAAMVTALNADSYKLEDMLALITGDFELSTSNWGTIVSDWADGMGIPADAAMQALAQGIKDGEISVNGSLDEILAGAKGYVIENSPKYMNPAGTEAGKGIGDGISSEESKNNARWSAEELAETVAEKFSGQDWWGNGYDASASYASGIRAGILEVMSASADVAAAVMANWHFSRPDVGVLRYVDVWGKHLSQTYAEGMRAGLPDVRKAVGELSDTVNYGLNDPSFYMSAPNGQQVTVINIDGMRVNDDIGIRQNVIDFAYALKARERGYVG